MELFAGFVTTDLVKGLAQVVKDFLTKLRLDLGMCRGQGYDGAAAMSRRMNGCQTVILETQPLASFVHCASHRLNLAISDTCNVTEFKVAFGTLSSISNFILGSPQRALLILSAAVRRCDQPPQLLRAGGRCNSGCCVWLP